MSKENKDKKENNENINTNENEKVVEKKAVKMVNILIPKDPLNKNNTFVPVGINGKIWQINRGVNVAVPVEVRNILKNAGYIS